MATAKTDRKRNTMKRSFVNGVCTWTYDAAPPLVFDTNKLSAEIREMIFENGLAKVWDAGAISADETTGKPAPDIDKRAAMEAVCENLYNGEWNGKRGAPGVNLDALVVAMSRVLKKGEDGCRAYLVTKDADARKAIAGSAQYAKQYAIAVAEMRPVRELDAEMTAELAAIPK